MPHLTGRAAWIAAGVAIFAIPASVVTLLTAGAGDGGVSDVPSAAPVVLEQPPALPIGSVPTGTRVPRLPEAERETRDRGGGAATVGPTATAEPGTIVTPPVTTPAPTPAAPAETFEEDGGSTG